MTGCCSCFTRSPARHRTGRARLPSGPTKPQPGGCRSAPVVDLFPAIDIRHGRVVRLSQGEATRQTVYGEDPVAVAERFAAAGARWIHVVDLDRAFGTGENLDVVARIAAHVAGRVRLQLGGGLRTVALVRQGLDQGVDRVVLGTAAAVDPAIVPEAV
ncbi:MAG TPA: HisA/HisF-related TIM barrel protein, partial [Gemmatimonadales bacterium]|nr:HisA/HisF-related TIM barrel protein [Gemmatimonadales bacterium]